MEKTAHLPPTQIETAAVQRPGLHLVTFGHDGVTASRLREDRATSVGRSEDCDVRVDTPLLSRAHFRVDCGPPLMVEDLGSSNGTKVNGRKLEPRARVAVEVGSLIEAGGTFFLVQDHAPHDTLVSPAPASQRTIAIAERGVPHGLVVADPAMDRLHQLVDLVARSDIPVLVVGETGAGKEVVAAAIHQRSPRVNKPYVSLNCAALPETLLESELFGFEKGAFTGANQSKPGLIESADGGTLFLDEIGEMPAPTQAKLLRVLENGELLRVGALKPRMVDVRFVAATNRNVQELVASGAFRRDLYFRLNGITIPIPPLRERLHEIPPLARMFLKQAADRAGRAAPTLQDDVLDRLRTHPWPGNVRELRNVIERALALCAGRALRPEHVLLDDSSALGPSPSMMQSGVVPTGTYGTYGTGAPLASHQTPLPMPAAGALAGDAGRGRLLRLDADTERRLIVEALDRAGGHQGKAAEILGISRRTLISRLDEYRLERPRKRMPAE